jgi:hypothetical protein
MQVEARAAGTGSNFFLFSFFHQNKDFFNCSVTAIGSPQACAQGRYRHGKKDGYSGKSGFF